MSRSLVWHYFDVDGNESNDIATCKECQKKIKHVHSYRDWTHPSFLRRNLLEKWKPRGESWGYGFLNRKFWSPQTSAKTIFLWRQWRICQYMNAFEKFRSNIFYVIIDNAISSFSQRVQRTKKLKKIGFYWKLSIVRVLMKSCWSKAFVPYTRRYSQWFRYWWYICLMRWGLDETVKYYPWKRQFNTRLFMFSPSPSQSFAWGSSWRI